ncbi:glycoside hydrolase family 3 protein [Desulfuromusa kysingii]|uniref:glycoside hydrolase family 3 protein n=1 Tax=Desulfuromusa kysingii TaxID=37625 RepID=UPI001C313E4C|nr:glycoside hydrolase family 3 protein [Desulfuromusa kysingii]
MPVTRFTAYSQTMPSPSSPSLDEKIGQMLMVGFRGATVDENHFIVRDIQKYHLGGVILFDYDVINAQWQRNIVSPPQVKALISSLQQVSIRPLLIAIDQEGGHVARLNERTGFPATCSHMELGQQDDLSRTLTETAKLARTLADIGVGLNLAPVIDLCSNPDNPVIAKYERCFSADPQKVAEHALHYIRAHHQHGILTTLKHFPGHGSSRSDSHLGLTDVSASWSARELLPYQQIISAGQADVIMTAHVFNRQLDSEYPATLSKATIHGILRQQLGFEGVVISDDMQMGAIVDYYGFDVAISKALAAGIDILVFGNNLHYDEQVVPRAIAVIKDLIRNGTLREERIDQSYQRIMRLKRSAKLDWN